MAEDKPSDGKQDFWTTLPGVITAIAAVITALGTIYVGYLQYGNGEQSTPTSIPTPPTVDSARATSIPTLPISIPTPDAPAGVTSTSGPAGDDLSAITPQEAVTWCVPRCSATLHFTGPEVDSESGIAYTYFHDNIGVGKNLDLPAGVLAEWTLCVGDVWFQDVGPTTLKGVCEARLWRE